MTLVYRDYNDLGVQQPEGHWRTDLPRALGFRVYNDLAVQEIQLPYVGELTTVKLVHSNHGNHGVQGLPSNLFSNCANTLSKHIDPAQ